VVSDNSPDPVVRAGDGDDQPEQMRVRRDKLERLWSQGINPYPVTFPRTTTIGELRSSYADLETDQQTGDRVGIAGRVMLSRTGGKLCFATLRDGTGEVQVMLSLDRLGEESLAAWKSTWATTSASRARSSRRGGVSSRCSATAGPWSPRRCGRCPTSTRG
jgi:lysyl-tRNA synthetase class II